MFRGMEQLIYRLARAGGIETNARTYAPLLAATPHWMRGGDHTHLIGIPMGRAGTGVPHPAPVRPESTKGRPLGGAVGNGGRAKLPPRLRVEYRGVAQDLCRIPLNHQPDGYPDGDSTSTGWGQLWVRFDPTDAAPWFATYTSG
ncbi:hypothetical protein [Pseudarthrobacter siccitolerans]